MEALAGGASVTAAAAAAGVGRATAYEWRQEDQDFAAEWDAAVEAGTDKLEDEAWRRAVDGVDEPLVSAGVLVTTMRRYSDGLLTTLLKARRPGTYKDRVEVSGKLDVADALAKARARLAAGGDEPDGG